MPSDPLGKSEAKFRLKNVSSSLDPCSHIPVLGEPSSWRAPATAPGRDTTPAADPGQVVTPLGPRFLLRLEAQAERLGGLPRAGFPRLLTCAAAAGLALKAPAASKTLALGGRGKTWSLRGLRGKDGTLPPLSASSPCSPSPRLFTQPFSFQPRPHGVPGTSAT